MNEFWILILTLFVQDPPPSYISYMDTIEQCDSASGYLYPRLSEHNPVIMCTRSTNFKEKELPEQNKEPLADWLKALGIESNDPAPAHQAPKIET